jgi:predicted MPP superfamily phosphohydrolase
VGGALARAGIGRVVGAAAAVAAGAWVAWWEPRRLVVEEVVLRLPRWTDDVDGLRVAVLSDLHGGVPYAGVAAIARWVDRANGLAPDLVLLGGDFVDAHFFWRRRLQPEPVAAELARLRAPLGVFAVLGNHDWKRDGPGVWAALEAAGTTVLENEARPAGSHLWVAGLADLRRRRPDLPRALANIPDGAPVILLAHDPDVFPFVPPRVALTVGGHTHGGQLAIPIIRRPAIPSRYGERYARGHVVEDGRHLYVTSGLGTSGLPVRAFAPPEIVLLELRQDVLEREDPPEDGER